MKTNSRMHDKYHDKYHNINSRLEANGFAVTNSTDLVPDKTMQSHNTKIIIKQSMNLVRYNS